MPLSEFEVESFVLTANSELKEQISDFPTLTSTSLLSLQSGPETSEPELKVCLWS